MKYGSIVIRHSSIVLSSNLINIRHIFFILCSACPLLAHALLGQNTLLDHDMGKCMRWFDRYLNEDMGLFATLIPMHESEAYNQHFLPSFFPFFLLELNLWSPIFSVNFFVFFVFFVPASQHYLKRFHFTSLLKLTHA